MPVLRPPRAGLCGLLSDDDGQMAFLPSRYVTESPSRHVELQQENPGGDKVGEGRNGREIEHLLADTLGGLVCSRLGT